MSSHGTFITTKNSITVSQYEDSVCSTEKNYSNYQPQSEQYNPKAGAKSKFNKNKTARRKEKLKDARRFNHVHIPPKDSHPKVLVKDDIEYVEQSLVEHMYPASLVASARSTLATLCPEEDISAKLIEVLEVVGALAISLPMCETPAQVASQIVLSIRALTSGSITANVLRQTETIEWCKRTFGFNMFQEQAGVPERAMSWLKELPHMKENWEALRHAPVFAKISGLISVAASIGLCSVSGLKWSSGGVDLFRVGTIQKHATAMDLVGAVLDTIICFIEGGFECFRQRSFRPLLFTDDAGRNLDDLYFPLIELHEHAMVFNLHEKPVLIKGERRTITDVEYSELLNEALELATRAFKTAKGTWQQGYLEKRLEVLHRNRAAYQAKRIDGSMRFAPYTVYVWGESGVGKSTVCQVLMADCLSASGVKPDFKDTAILKETDKFDSTLKGDTNGIFFDDLGNTKSEFLDKAPTERIIDINNNMITYANKADLNEKGKIEIRPRVFVISSNAALAYHGRKGSIKPYSIVRRADMHISVKVKPKYAREDGRLDSRKATRAFPGDSLVNDIWDLELYVPNSKGNGNMLSPYEGGDKAVPMSVNKMLRICTSQCKEHFENQRVVVRKGQRLVESRMYCSDCKLASDLCLCYEEAFSDIHQGCQEIEDELAAMGVFAEFEEQTSVEDTLDFISQQFTDMGRMTNVILPLIPHCFFNNRVIQAIYLACFAREFLRVERTVRWGVVFSFICFSMAFLFAQAHVNTLYAILLFPVHIFVYYSVLAKWRDDKLTELANRRGSAMELFASIRQSKVFQFFSVCLVGKLIYDFVKLFRTVTSIQQSALAPKSVSEIEKRDAEENPWANAVPATLHVSDKAQTMTHDQVISKVEKNMLHGYFVENDFQQRCDVIALGGNLYGMPYHVFRNRCEMKAVLTRADPLQLNSTFRAIISAKHMMPVPGKDFCIVSISSGGISADITHLFPSAITANGFGTFMYREPDGSMTKDRVRITYTKNSEAGGPGYDVTLPYNTYVGLCGAVVVAEFARNCIAGIHLRGVPDAPLSKCLTLTREELLETIALAKKRWGSALVAHSNGDFPRSRYQQQVCTSTSIHPQSPTNYLPLGSTVEVLGQAGTRATHTKSQVRVTPISEAVAEETGVARQHGPPQFHRWKMWQASLAHSANPSPGIEATLLDAAYHDYVNGLVDTFRKFDSSWIRRELKPLTDMQALCGVDGKRFIDSIPKGTSPGFGLKGKKRDHITLLDPIDFPDFNCPAEACPAVMEEVSKMKEILLSGERYYSIFKACVKDEPTKLDKTKVRVFQAADWATQLVIRQYFLPLARVLSLFPKESECAVGVNAQGPEWDELAKHMRMHGTDRILAGDYSKYDLRMPAQLILAAFKVLITIAERCGQYSEDDLTIMRGVATEVAFSCVAYNGDLIIHSGSNPSGQNLTVYINCIVNSLQLRCAYFHLHPKNVEVRPFREVASIITYGDDVKGSVREGYDWYNHISYAQFLKERDMVFTMPDKESTPTPYMDDDDADFLKRKNIFNPDTGLIHGALDEESIFKSLHTVLESKVVTLEEQSISNIDGALREWWQYGRDVYEQRRSQMKRVAFQCGLTDGCKMLGESYDDRLKLFRRRYLEEEEETAQPDVTEYVASVGDKWDFTD